MVSQLRGSDRLEKFDPDAECPKCGFSDETMWPTVTYCPGDDTCPVDGDGNPGEEHLHETCDLCGYEWLVSPLRVDAKPTSKARQRSVESVDRGRNLRGPSRLSSLLETVVEESS